LAVYVSWPKDCLYQNEDEWNNRKKNNLEEQFFVMSLHKAAFGGGCFWGMEKFFRKEFKDGLKTTAVGFMGGSKKNPSYESVCTGTTGHAEVVYVEYDNGKVNYKDLLNFFFQNP